MVDVVVDVFGGRRDGAQVVAQLIADSAAGRPVGSGEGDWWRAADEAGDEVGSSRSPSCRRNALGCGRRG